MDKEDLALRILLAAQDTSHLQITPEMERGIRAVDTSKNLKQIVFEEIQRVALPPSYERFPLLIYLYICPQCGWWDISNGISEVFGDLDHKPGLCTDPCEKCGHAPMTLVKRTDSLHIAIDAAKG